MSPKLSVWAAACEGEFFRLNDNIPARLINIDVYQTKQQSFIENNRKEGAVCRPLPQTLPLLPRSSATDQGREDIRQHEITTPRHRNAGAHPRIQNIKG